jgi:hypothetical protein
MQATEWYSTVGDMDDWLDAEYGTLAFTVEVSRPMRRLTSLALWVSAPISIVPGFPTDSARATGGNFTPFAVFFANPTTMYVTDEGTGNALDKTSHGGLEKWSLGADGLWQLDYVLTNGLIGTVDQNLNGADGQYPDVTTVGLRNLTGVVDLMDGTVTLYGTTSTSSASGDNGADPNKVVVITDQLSATSLTGGERVLRRRRRADLRHRLSRCRPGELKSR